MPFSAAAAAAAAGIDKPGPPAAVRATGHPMAQILSASDHAMVHTMAPAMAAPRPSHTLNLATANPLPGATGEAHVIDIK